jgi:hypothetical protein
MTATPEASLVIALESSRTRGYPQSSKSLLLEQDINSPVDLVIVSFTADKGGAGLGDVHRAGIGQTALA